MTWKDFVNQWRPKNLTQIGIPNSTVHDWKAGNKEPAIGWQRDAAEYWIEAKAGEKTLPKAAKKKTKGGSL